jgi:hypothetical protein
VAPTTVDPVQCGPAVLVEQPDGATGVASVFVPVHDFKPAKVEDNSALEAPHGDIEDGAATLDVKSVSNMAVAATKGENS